MAIYHCSMKAISRREGQSVVAAAAYRHACKLTDSRTGETHDYSRKRGVEESSIYFPLGVNLSWAQNREQLWNAAEVAEKRKDARVGRELVLALPVELSTAQRCKLAAEMARHLAERYGVAVDVAIHKPSREGDQRNYHAHMLMSVRQVTKAGFGKKVRELDDHKRGPEEVEHIRAEWARLANRALENAGKSVQIDHRSFQRQELKRMPSLHLGASASAMERRGIQTRLGNRNRAAQAINVKVAALEAARAQVRQYPQKSPEMPLKDAEPKRAAQRPLEQEKPSTGQTRAATPPEKAEPLKGAELLPVIEKLKHEMQAAYTAWQATIAEERQAASALADARKAIEQHNVEFKETGFFKKAWKSAEINARAEKLSEAEKVAAVTSEAAKEKKAQASRTYHARQAEFEKMLAEYEKSPHGLEVKAEKRREMERRRAEKEATRQQSRSMDRGR